MHCHFQLGLGVIAALSVQTLNNHAVLQIFISYTDCNLIMMFRFLGYRIPRRIPIILQLLLNPLRKVIIIGQHDHLIVIVHVPEHELQVLLLPRDHLLAQLRRLWGRFYQLALPLLVEAVD